MPVPEQQLRIVAVGLLLADSFGFDLRRIADPQLHIEFRQQPLEPARISGGLHPHAHADCALLQIAIKLLGFSIAVVQSPLAALSRLAIGKRDVLIARVVTHAYNDHVRLLSPEPWVVNNQSLPGSKEPTLL